VEMRLFEHACLAIEIYNLKVELEWNHGKKKDKRWREKCSSFERPKYLYAYIEYSAMAMQVHTNLWFNIFRASW
jgi:hypothetical protein